jgi:hypothetical protein
VRRFQQHGNSPARQHTRTQVSAYRRNRQSTGSQTAVNSPSPQGQHIVLEKQPGQENPVLLISTAWRKAISTISIASAKPVNHPLNMK